MNPEDAARRLEAERFAGPVREWKATPPSREYLDLLAIAQHESEAHDEMRTA